MEKYEALLRGSLPIVFRHIRQLHGSYGALALPKVVSWMPHLASVSLNLKLESEEQRWIFPAQLIRLELQLDCKNALRFIMAKPHLFFPELVHCCPLLRQLHVELVTLPDLVPSLWDN